MSILEEILDEKRREVAERKATAPLSELKTKPLPKIRNFAAALENAPFPGIIAEIKRASPSRGDIRQDLDPTEVARAYADNGAACISVLTDEKFFKGKLEYLNAVREAAPTTPLLRKDFLIDEYQVWESRAAGADAVLLIVAALDDPTLEALFQQASALTLDTLIEVHDEEELDRALSIIKGRSSESSSRVMLGINNRNLKTFQVDLDVTKTLAARARAEALSFPEMLIVSESGIAKPSDISYLRSIGANAFLIGESLVSSGDPADNIRVLIDHEY